MSVVCGYTIRPLGVLVVALRQSGPPAGSGLRHYVAAATHSGANPHTPDANAARALGLVATVSLLEHHCLGLV